MNITTINLEIPAEQCTVMVDVVILDENTMIIKNIVFSDFIDYNDTIQVEKSGENSFLLKEFLQKSDRGTFSFSVPGELLENSVFRNFLEKSVLENDLYWQHDFGGILSISVIPNNPAVFELNILLKKLNIHQ